MELIYEYYDLAIVLACLGAIVGAIIILAVSRLVIRRDGSAEEEGE